MPAKDGEYHAPGRRRIGPGLRNGLKSSVFLLDRLRDAQQLGRGACEMVETSDEDVIDG